MSEIDEEEDTTQLYDQLELDHLELDDYKDEDLEEDYWFKYTFTVLKMNGIFKTYSELWY